MYFQQRKTIAADHAEWIAANLFAESYRDSRTMTPMTIP
jgi:hypothetical protein